MTNAVPLFEESTSQVYYSNDGLLHVVEVTEEDDAFRTFNVMRVVELTDPAADGKVVLTTHERVLADAYVAGYDLATARDRIEPSLSGAFAAGLHASTTEPPVTDALPAGTEPEFGRQDLSDLT